MPSTALLPDRLHRGLHRLKFRAAGADSPAPATGDHRTELVGPHRRCRARRAQDVSTTHATTLACTPSPPQRRTLRPTRCCYEPRRGVPSVTGEIAATGYFQQRRLTGSGHPTLLLWNDCEHVAVGLCLRGSDAWNRSKGALRIRRELPRSTLTSHDPVRRRRLQP